MFAKERYRTIEQLLQEQKSVSVVELKQRFGVSAETVRRDLYEMEKEGLLYRVHGGAMLPQAMGSWTPLSIRREEACTEKRELSAAALSFVAEGDTLFLECGSTAILFAKELLTRFSDLRVITNSLSVMQLLQESPFTLISLGGEYMAEEDGFTGQLAVETVTRLHAKHAFVFPSAVSLTHGAAVFSMNFVGVAQAFAQNADHVYCLADSHKFGRDALYHMPLSPSTLYVTDSALPDEAAHLFRESGFHLLRAGEKQI